MKILRPARPGRIRPSAWSFSRTSPERYKCEVLFEDIVATEGLRLLGWRSRATEHSSIGQTAIRVRAIVRQVFIARPDGLTDDLAFERKLLRHPQTAKRGIRTRGLSGGEKFYVCSLSPKR